MLRNYFTIALRNLRKNKLHSLINLSGLSIGLACCLFIFIYVQHELSYDRFNQKSGQIYRLTEVLHMPKEDNARAVSSPPMGPVIQANFPEVLKMVRINYSSRDISYGEKKNFDALIIYGDSTFFDVFTFPFLDGDASMALEKPYSVVLSQSTAKKYFGDAEPVGKTMMLSDTIPLKVTGVIKDVPENSHFKFDMLLSRSTISEMRQRMPEDNWFNNNYYTYLLLRENVDPGVLERKISQYIRKEMGDEKKGSGLWYDLKLQPLTDIHLKSNLRAEINPNSDISYVYIFSVAAIFILLIACSNFINLSTAKSLERTKEIGLRKTVGASRAQLISQFLGESFFFCLLAGIASILIVLVALPYFNELTGLLITTENLAQPLLILAFIVIIALVSLAAGIYPALLLSSFRPVLALKESVRSGWHHLLMKKGLVVFQFTIAIALIIGTTIVYSQLRYIQNRNLGLNKDQVVQLTLPLADQTKGKTIQAEFQRNPHILNSSLTDFSFSNGISSVAMLPEGAGENEVNSIPVIAIDENFLSTFKIPLVAGRDFSTEFSSDPEQSFLLNETAAKKFGWTSQSALGKGINWGLGKIGKVVGVAKDFNFGSLHDNIRPLILHIERESYANISVRIQPGEIMQTLKEMETSWKKAGAICQFKYSFLDEDFLTLYKDDQKMQSILGVFTVLSIFIACLGIFGLTAYTIRQRFKEIGVRKVLGAGSGNIVWLFSRELLSLLFLSIVAASVLGWVLMNKWLEDFAYHIDPSLWIFVMAGLLTMIIAFLTAGALAFKASLASPVKNLRTE